MSLKIYNGFKFDKDYSLRELNNILAPIRKKVQEKAEQLYFQKVVEEFLYIYDCYTIWGEETALARMREFSEMKELDWLSIFYRIDHGVYKKIKEAENASKRDFDYDLSCSIQILPTSDKLLFTLYGEKMELCDIVKDAPFTQEYHYQNQSDKPEDISEEEWAQRYNDWKEAMPEWIAARNGFSVNFVDIYSFNFASGFDNLRATKFNIPDIKTRAKRLAFDVGVPEHVKKITLSFLCSDEYKEFLQEQIKVLSPKLKPVETAEDIISLILPK